MDFDPKKSFTEQYAPKPPSVDEKLPQQRSKSMFLDPGLYARYQLADALIDAGAEELGYQMLMPGSEEDVARIMAALKKTG